MFMIKFWNKKHDIGLDDKVFNIKGKLYSLNDLPTFGEYKNDSEDFIILKTFDLFSQFVNTNSVESEENFREHYKKNKKHIRALFLGEEDVKVLFFKDHDKYTEMRFFFVPIYLELKEIFGDTFSCKELEENVEEYVFKTVLARKRKTMNDYKDEIIKEFEEIKKLQEEQARLDELAEIEASNQNSCAFFGEDGEELDLDDSSFAPVAVAAPAQPSFLSSDKYSYWQSTVLKEKNLYNISNRPFFSIIDFDIVHERINEAVTVEKDKMLEEIIFENPYTLPKEPKSKYKDGALVVNKFFEKGLVVEAKKLINQNKRLTNTHLLNILKQNARHNYISAISEEVFVAMKENKLKPSKGLQKHLFQLLNNDPNLFDNSLFNYCLVKHKIDASLLKSFGDHPLTVFFAFLFNYEGKDKFKKKALTRLVFAHRNNRKSYERFIFEEVEQNILDYILKYFSNEEQIRAKYSKVLERIEKYAHSRIDKEIVVF